ncbi:MAG: glycosyltransferase family 2 protein [Ferruginibacter sp.]
MKDSPLLSICLISYNQEEFILEALKGVAMQEVDFEYELLIADDRSTDQTPALIREYISTGAIRRVRFLDRAANLGMQRNWHDALTQARGKYVALLEGDDYWTDRHKLSVQVGFLEAHPQYAGCFHNTEERHRGSNHCVYAILSVPQRHGCWHRDTGQEQRHAHLFTGFQDIGTAAHAEWFFTLKMVDWPFSIMNSQFGPYYYLPKVMGVHRLHSGSAWACNQKDNLRYIGDAYRAMCDHFQHDQLFSEHLHKAYMQFGQQDVPQKGYAGPAQRIRRAIS